MSDLDELLRSFAGGEQTLEQLLGQRNTENSHENASPQSDLTTQAFSAAQLLSSMISPPRDDAPVSEPKAFASEAPMRKAPLPAQPSTQQAPAFSLSAMAEVVPQLLQAMSGDSSALAEHKVNLVRAIKPYAVSHEASIDRAIRIAGIAKAAKSALSSLKKP